MNARILDLAKQSGFKTDWQHQDIQQIKQARYEKFAELIVLECAEFARQYNLENAERSYMIHNAMKQHFGVKE